MSNNGACAVGPLGADTEAVVREKVLGLAARNGATLTPTELDELVRTPPVTIAVSG